VLLALAFGLLTACRGGGAQPGSSSDALPTGLVGPVAPTVGPQALRYIALGDSYTFGDGVRQRDRWPNQLVHMLRPELDLDLVANLAGRSVASLQVLENQLPELLELAPQFVSVQVGANDVCLFDDDTPATYAENMAQVLDTILGVVDANRTVVLTIPDFTLAPSPPDTCRDEPEQQAERIAQLNGILATLAGERGVTVVDISPVADRVAVDPSLVTSDGTYPSAKQYAGWADLAALAIRGLLREPAGSGTLSPPGESGTGPPSPTPTPSARAAPPTVPGASPPGSPEPVFLTSRT